MVEASAMEWAMNGKDIVSKRDGFSVKTISMMPMLVQL
jgi:hypothetical protein